MPLPRLIFFAWRGAAFAASSASIFVLFIAPHGAATLWAGFALTAAALLFAALASRAKNELE